MYQDRMQVVADLLTTVRVLQIRGWTQKEMQNEDGAVCLIGAARIATIGKAICSLHDIRDPHAVARFHAVRGALFDWLHTAPTVWNDHVASSATEVIDTVMRCAEFQARLA